MFENAVTRVTSVTRNEKGYRSYTSYTVLEHYFLGEKHDKKTRTLI